MKIFKLKGRKKKAFNKGLKSGLLWRKLKKVGGRDKLFKVDIDSMSEEVIDFLLISEFSNTEEYESNILSYLDLESRVIGLPLAYERGKLKYLIEVIETTYTINGIKTINFE